MDDTVYPIQKERAIIVDIGRKYFSKEWIFKLIEYMYEINLNTLQIHFSENEGFRITSDLYPEITSEQHLTKQDMKEIIAYAKRHQIEIIPDFDTPGHLQRILSYYPEYQLEKLEDGKIMKDKRSLDITSKKAREFIKTIYKEFAELFHGSRYFHIGADEFINFDVVEKYPQLVVYAKEHYGEEATGMETYIEYTNEMIDYIISLGFIPRVWNDGFYRKNRKSLVQLDKRAQITYWTKWHKDMAEVDAFIKQGHKLINFNDNYFYYVVGEGASYTYPTAEKVREQWQIQKFAHEQILNDEQMQSVLGTSFAIWCDIPEAQDEEEVFEGIKEPLQEMAKKILRV